MLKVLVDDYIQILERCYKTKEGLLVLGPPGIGKSEIPRQVFQRIAEKKNKEFIYWDKITKERKLELFKNPEKYFVFCDQRLSQMDTTDMRGIPRLNGEMLDSMPPAWVMYFTQEKADGLLFFDEINLATPIVVGSAYQIIHDRSIADMKISDSVLMIAAGNRMEDKAFTFELPLPLRDRFCEAELMPSLESWTKWATKAKINPHLISFVNWKESYLYRVSDTGADKSTTPRGIVRASRMLGSMDITAPEANMYVSLSVGEAFATEFQAYVKYFAELDWKVIFANPESVKKFDTSKLFATAGGLGEIFMKDYKKFDDICGVVQYLPEEFSIMTLRLMKDGQANSFKRRAEKSKIFKTVLGPKLGKFIIDTDSSN